MPSFVGRSDPSSNAVQENFARSASDWSRGAAKDPSYGREGLLPNCCGGEKNSPPKLGGVSSPNEVRREAGWFLRKTSYWIALEPPRLLAFGSQAPLLT